MRLLQCAVLVAAAKIGTVLLGVQTVKCQGKDLALREGGGQDSGLEISTFRKAVVPSSSRV